MNRSFFEKFVLNWFVLSILSYTVLSAIQLLIILPIEISLLGSNTMVASVLFLPHAVRVLTAWMVGPRAIFALFPAAFMVDLITKIVQNDTMAPSDVIVVLVGVLCAPVAFELMRTLRINIYPSNSGVISWRNLVFAGLLSSILNSFFSTFFSEGKFPIEDTFTVLTRFVIGDVLGLVVIMCLLLELLKAFRRRYNV